MTDKKRYAITIICLILILANIAYMFMKSKKKIVYLDSLDETVVSVDGYDYKLKDLAYYIARKETDVEEKAILYNPDDPNEFWNIHTNGEFVRIACRDNTMQLAIHDFIFNKIAEDEGIFLTEDEKAFVKNDEMDFWEDLGEERQKLIGISEEELLNQMNIAALAEKTEEQFAEDNDRSKATYEYDGSGYAELLKEHKVEKNDSLWKGLSFGNITLVR